jgi:hypothetical protein
MRLKIISVLSFYIKYKTDSSSWRQGDEIGTQIMTCFKPAAHAHDSY